MGDVEALTGIGGSLIAVCPPAPPPRALLCSPPHVGSAAVSNAEFVSRAVDAAVCVLFPPSQRPLMPSLILPTITSDEVCVDDAALGRGPVPRLFHDFSCKSIMWDEMCGLR